MKVYGPTAKLQNGHLFLSGEHYTPGCTKCSTAEEAMKSIFNGGPGLLAPDLGKIPLDPDLLDPEELATIEEEKRLSMSWIKRVLDSTGFNNLTAAICFIGGMWWIVNTVWYVAIGVRWCFRHLSIVVSP